MKRHRTSESAFTLVELLIVIGIIAILIAIMLPVLNRVRQQAQRTACAANLFQLGQGMTMYTGQYRFFPSIYVEADKEMAVCWPVMLRQILGGNQKVFYCPAQDSKCEWKADAAGAVQLASEVHTHFGYEIGERLLLSGERGGNGAWFSYGLNILGAHERVGGMIGPEYLIPRGVGMVHYSAEMITVDDQIGVLRATSVRRPSEFILMGDVKVDGDWDTQISPFAGVPHEGLVGDIHSGGANILFLDGHVQWYLRSQLTVKFPPVAEEAAKQAMWNADGQGSRAW